jgi:hippurate hydrolase
MPHDATDPVPIACEIVLALETAITRRVGVFDPAVVTFGQVRAGTAHNVIPETAFLHGTIRTVSEETRATVHELVARVAGGIARAHGAEVEVDIEQGYPVTVNDPDTYETVMDLAARIGGEDRAVSLPTPMMGAEDWSYVLQRVPGAMAFLGACPQELEPSQASPNHSNRVVFDESVMPSGVALYCAFALHGTGSSA